MKKKVCASDFCFCFNMCRGCIICLWSSTWAGRSRTRWLTSGCRTPAMKPSIRSDMHWQEKQTHKMTVRLLITFETFTQTSSVGCFYVSACCSSAWTWRSWRRWRRMQVWGTEVWAGWQVKGCRCLNLMETERQEGLEELEATEMLQQNI